MAQDRQDQPPGDEKAAPLFPGWNYGDKRFAPVWQKFLAALGARPELLQQHAANQAGLFTAVMAAEPKPANGEAEPGKTDRRFAHKDWEAHPFYRYMKESYALNAGLLHEVAAGMELAADERQALEFMLKQLTSAMAPTNHPLTNPEVAQATAATGGDNLRRGMENYMADLRAGAITLSDPEAFEVGRDLAITPGKVIAQNHVMQLIEYLPTQARTRARPLLIVPPCINKYYILDLSKRDSFIRYLLDQGLRVFLLSWVNAGPEQQGLAWDDYVAAGVIEAIETVGAVSGQKQINTLGYCIGGTLLASALAVMRSYGDERAASMSLLTAFLDFCDTGDIGLFVDEELVAAKEREFADGGVFDGMELQRTFGYLRPDDLVWPYVVRNYMLGEKPQPFNILHWNGDATNLPGRMYAWYLRHTYLANDLKDGVAICGRQVKVGGLDLPGMHVACERDHIVPWGAAYASARLAGTKSEFVLSSSGHVAGVVNPPAKGKGYYYAAAGARKLEAQAASWQKRARRNEGSWWPHFASWLRKRSGALAAAPKQPGDYRHRPIEDAPGSYVTAPRPPTS